MNNTKILAHLQSEQHDNGESRIFSSALAIAAIALMQHYFSYTLQSQASLVDRLQRSLSLNDLSDYDNANRMKRTFCVSSDDSIDTDEDDSAKLRANNIPKREMSVTRVHADLDSSLASLIQRFDQRTMRSKTAKEMVLAFSIVYLSLC